MRRIIFRRTWVLSSARAIKSARWGSQIDRQTLRCDFRLRGRVRSCSALHVRWNYRRVL